MKKTIGFLFMAGLLVLFSAGVFAEDTASPSTNTIIAELQAQIAKLQAELKKFQELRGTGAASGEIRETRQEIKETRKEIHLSRSLYRGLSGEDVQSLQEFLAEDSEVYPEGLITGFFGVRTEEAVRRFQRKHGVDALGIVGPKTRERLQTLALQGAGSSNMFPPGLAKKFDSSGNATFQAFTSGTTSRNTQGDGTSTPGRGAGEVILCHYPPGNPANRHSLVVGGPALQAHLLHGDTLGACPSSEGGATTTPPDTLAPVITNVAATTTTASTTHITWTTNELSDSTAWFATSSPIVTGTSTPSVMSSTMVLSHDASLTGLSASTTYYFIVGSKDVVGNAALSPEHSFLTAP